MSRTSSEKVYSKETICSDLTALTEWEAPHPEDVLKQMKGQCKKSTVSYYILFVLLGRWTISSPINHSTSASIVTINSICTPHHGLPCSVLGKLSQLIAKYKTAYICLHQLQLYIWIFLNTYVGTHTLAHTFISVLHFR